MGARTIPERFQVAFSLAGEQRKLVRQVAEAVENRLGRAAVFYDDWYEHFLAGGDADVLLQDIYGERSELVVLCISHEYGKKPWTRTEHAAIRARYMQAYTSDSEIEQRRILPLRFGDGDVRGIPMTTIAPDVRERPPEQTAQLIVDRLQTLRPERGVHVGEEVDWPTEPPELRWPMADHSEVRAAFGELLTRTSAFRLLPVRGPSGTGKTHVSKQMLANALHVEQLECGRFDFKGTSGMDAEVRTLASLLDVPVPPARDQLGDRLGHILDELKARRRPTLLVFDTYEAAGEAIQWIERELLTGLIRAPWMRVAILGHAAPDPSGSVWESVSSPTIELRPPPPEDWFDFGRVHERDVTLDFVRQAHKLCRGSAAVLAELLGPQN